jgi:hypothetical protein
MRHDGNDDSDLYDLFGEAPHLRYAYRVAWPYPERTERMDGEEFAVAFPHLDPHDADVPEAA